MCTQQTLHVCVIVYLPVRHLMGLSPSTASSRCQMVASTFSQFSESLSSGYQPVFLHARVMSLPCLPVGSCVSPSLVIMTTFVFQVASSAAWLVIILTACHTHTHQKRVNNAWNKNSIEIPTTLPMCLTNWTHLLHDVNIRCKQHDRSRCKDVRCAKLFSACQTLHEIWRSHRCRWVVRKRTS